MTNQELVLNMLAELLTTDISKARNPQNFAEHADIARRGGTIAKEAREKLEAETGKKVVSPSNALGNDHLIETKASVFDEDEESK